MSGILMVPQYTAEEVVEAGLDHDRVAQAEKFLDQIELPDNKSVAMIAVGHDLEPCAYVHINPLSTEQLRDYNHWAGQADLRLERSSYGPSADSVKFVAKKLWPGVKVYQFLCTCCESDDLVELNTCHYCGLLDTHEKGCPMLLDRPGYIARDDPIMLALAIHQEGYDMACHATSWQARCRVWVKYNSPRTSSTWRLGYKSAKRYRKQVA